MYQHGAQRTTRQVGLRLRHFDHRLGQEYNFTILSSALQTQAQVWLQMAKRYVIEQLERSLGVQLNSGVRQGGTTDG